MASYNFNGTSGNQNKGNKILKRIEFEFKNTSYKFAVNPESYSQSEPGRVTVTQTKGGAFVEFFGSALVEITLTGTTGFKNGGSDAESGYKKFKALRDIIKSVYDNITDGSEISDSDLLKFYNFTDNEYYYTVPDKFELSRSKSQPMLYKYNIHLYAIRRLGESAPSNSTGIIGNPIGVESTAARTVSDSRASNSTNVVYEK